MLSPKKILPHLALFLFLLLVGSLTAKAISISKEKTKISINTTQTQSLFNYAIKLADGIPYPSQKIETLSAIAVKLAQTKQTQHSLQLFNEVIHLAKTNSEFEDYDKQIALRDISIQLSQAGQTEAGLKLVKTIPSKLRQAEALNGIAANLADRGEFTQARQVLLEALENARGITGDYAYESNGSCSNDKFDVLSKIAGNLSLLGRLDTALQVAKSVTGCTSATGESTQDYQTWAFLGILGHISRIDQLKQTWSSAQQIKNNSEKASIWSAIAVKSIDMGETPLALSIAKKFVAQIPIPQNNYEGAKYVFDNREKDLGNIAIELAQKHQFDAAIRVAQSMTGLNPTFDNNQSLDFSIKSLTLGEVASQLTLANKVSLALQLANNIPDTEGKAVGLIKVAAALEKIGDSNQAGQIFENLPLPPTPTNPKDFNGNQRLSRIAVALVNAGQLDQSLKITQSISDSILREATLTDIGTQLADLGQVNQALKFVNKVTGKGSQATILLAVASKLVQLGKLEQAYQLVSPVAGSPSSLIGSNKDKLLVKIANQYVIRRQQSLAIKVVDNISDAELKAQAIAAIAAGIPLKV